MTPAPVPVEVNSAWYRGDGVSELSTSPDVDDDDGVIGNDDVTHISAPGVSAAKLVPVKSSSSKNPKSKKGKKRGDETTSGLHLGFFLIGVRISFLGR